jgi:hypothetical protein
MNFDPRTKAKEEQEDNEGKLRLYAMTCASLDASYKTLDPESDDAFNLQEAFDDIWDKAIFLTNARDFYNRIDNAKKVLGIS